MVILSSPDPDHIIVDGILWYTFGKAREHHSAILKKIRAW